MRIFRFQNYRLTEHMKLGSAQRKNWKEHFKQILNSIDRIEDMEAFVFIGDRIKFSVWSK